MSVKHLGIFLYFQNQLHMTIATNRRVNTRSIDDIISRVKNLVLSELTSSVIVKASSMESKSKIKFGLNRQVLAHPIEFIDRKQEKTIDKIREILLPFSSDIKMEKIYHITTKDVVTYESFGKLLNSTISGSDNNNLQLPRSNRIVIKESGHNRILFSYNFPIN